MDGGSGMGGALGWWVLGLVLLISAIVVVIGVRFRSGRRGNPPVDQGSTRRLEGRNTARKLLDDRYARGEIGTDEYRERVITLDQET